MSLLNTFTIWALWRDMLLETIGVFNVRLYICWPDTVRSGGSRTGGLCSQTKVPVQFGGVVEPDYRTSSLWKPLFNNTGCMKGTYGCLCISIPHLIYFEAYPVYVDYVSSSWRASHLAICTWVRWHLCCSARDRAIKVRGGRDNRWVVWLRYATS